MKTYMFPGQGSQSKGMGGDLFERYPDWTERASTLLGYSIRELCLEDPREELNKTQFTQPALYVVNALSWRARHEQDGDPDFVAGHSLGEFNALLAAGVFDFETGLRLVHKRGELMSQVNNGAMAAILNASKDRIESILDQNDLDQIDLANYNTAKQIVVSGDAAQIAKAESLFQGDGMRFYPLNTSGAFHSRFMLPAKERFARFLKDIKFADPQVPVVANVTGRPYQPGRIRGSLASQISSTVRWSESVEYLIGQGTDANPMTFEEVGFGDVLTRLVLTIQQLRATGTPAEAQAPAKTEAAAGGDSADGHKSVHTASSNGVGGDAAPVQGPEAARPGQAAASGDAADKVARWNASYPVGTSVRSSVIPDTALHTRSEALVLFGHRAAVYLQGYQGYFDLDELVAA